AGQPTEGDGHRTCPAQRRGGDRVQPRQLPGLHLLRLGAQPAKRLVRFMAKKEIFDNRIAGPLMRGMHHISVDRAAGKASYDEAVDRLRSGEVVGVFPEATISRSFTVKPIKSGAVRMAADAGVPVVPMALWGTQRLWTKGRPRTLTK